MNDAWWIPILEKAYAKFSVNYANLAGGPPGLAMRDMTNAPILEYKNNALSAGEVFRLIDEHDRKGHVMTGTVMGGGYGNLVTGHAYTLIGAIQLSNGANLVKLRNPWGREQYNGEYSDEDSVWTPALLSEAGHTNNK